MRIAASIHPCSFRLQKADARMLFSFEGKLRIDLPDKTCSPLHLNSLRVTGLHVLPQTNCTYPSATLALQLCASVSDAAGHNSSFSALLQITGIDAHAAQSCMHAAIRLVHSHQESPDTFFIRAHILLTQTYDCCSFSSCQSLPLYPQLSVKRFGKSGEKHKSNVIL